MAPRSVDSADSCASRQDHLNYYASTGLSDRLSRLMYQAQRAQDHGNKDQALAFYHTVLAENPSCTQATENVMVLMQASQPVLQEALDKAAELAAEQAAAEQAAAQQAAAQQAAADLQQELGGITADMQRIVVRDARFAADGTLVCRSTYNAHHRGIGWDDNDNYTSRSSGALPHEERFRCWRCDGFGHMRRVPSGLTKGAV